MRYALLFYHASATEIPESERGAVIAAMLAEMRAWQADCERAGVFHTTLALPEEVATSLRKQGNDVLVTDGPFAETKEILGGLAVLECAHLDEALGWAKRCPLLRIGRIEVRPEAAAPRTA
jgi:hypothetical protein